MMQRHVTVSWRSPTLKPVSLFVLASIALACVSSASAKTVTLSNVKLPVDQYGNKLITGEASLLFVDGVYYFYFNDWGDCPGVDCCGSKTGCASCCFNDFIAEKKMQSCSNPYLTNHSIVAYKTTDFVTWENLGVALPINNRKPGIEFRPCVVYNEKTKLFVMWYEDRGAAEDGYAVAVSGTPQGPFKTTHINITLPGHGRVGDYNIFVDDDGKAYHVRTGFDVVALNDEYTGGVSLLSSFATPKASEGPVFFKREGFYYILSGTGCCACVGGATVYVMRAKSLKGPWEYLGDVGSNPTKFDPYSRDNYVTKAQASTVFTVKATDGTMQYIWLGNQWNSGLAEKPPGPRHHGLLYFSVLQFNETGAVQQIRYEASVTFDRS